MSMKERPEEQDMIEKQFNKKAVFVFMEKNI